jgi:hypothetical protein
MPKKLCNLSVGNAVSERVGGEAVPIAVGDSPNRTLKTLEATPSF